MSVAAFSPLRVGLIAHNTLREAARQRLLHALVFLALALVLGARWLRDFHFGASELKFLADCGMGAMTFFGAALVIAATAQLFFSEIENRTVLTLLAKPVGRGEFVLGKFLGVAALAAVFCALLTALLAAVLWSREAELIRLNPEGAGAAATVHYPSLALAGFLQWLKLTVLAGLTLLVATFAQSQLFTVVTGFFVLVICHLQYLAHDAYARAGSAVGRILAAGVSWLFPNFQVFGLVDSLAAADAPGWPAILRVSVYGACYIAAAGGLAVFSFRQREL